MFVKTVLVPSLVLLVLLLSTTMLDCNAFTPRNTQCTARNQNSLQSEFGRTITESHPNEIVPIEEAQECSQKLLVDTVDGVPIRVWYQTWGNRRSGIPVLFVHGGPGQCVADYENINSAFFAADKYFVVEIDQRGTGRSTPSVRDDAKSMSLYRSINIQQMSRDFEVVREHLNITKWLVFGGSWGSTLGLDYAERYPGACLGLIVRGIFLSIEEEMDAVYSLRAIQALAEAKQRNQRYVQEFNAFYDVANREYKNLVSLWRQNNNKNNAANDGAADDVKQLLSSILRKGGGMKEKEFFPEVLDPDNAYGILKLYERLIVAGDREATWKFYVFENNLMEEDESELLDFEVIDESTYAEARSVSFFEARLFLRGVYEKEVEEVEEESSIAIGSNSELDLLGSLQSLSSSSVPVWVVQGTGDAVCPDKFARKLVAKLESAGVLQGAYFVDAGHKASSINIRDKLIEVVEMFYSLYTT